MKTMLVMFIVVASACVTSSAPARKAPAAPMAPTPPPVSVDDCGEFACGQNGTQVTGLTDGDRLTPIHAITLPSGEVITLR